MVPNTILPFPTALLAPLNAIAVIVPAQISKMIKKQSPAERLINLIVPRGVVRADEASALGIVCSTCGGGDRTAVPHEPQNVSAAQIPLHSSCNNAGVDLIGLQMLFPPPGYVAESQDTLHCSSAISHRRVHYHTQAARLLSISPPLQQGRIGSWNRRADLRLFQRILGELPLGRTSVVC